MTAGFFFSRVMLERYEAYEEALRWAVQVVDSATAPGDLQQQQQQQRQQQQQGGHGEAISPKLRGSAALEAAFALFARQNAQGISRSALAAACPAAAAASAAAVAAAATGVVGNMFGLLRSVIMRVFLTGFEGLFVLLIFPDLGFRV